MRSKSVAAAVAMALAWSAPSFAADLPDATRTILSDLKLNESILAGLDRELTVPDGWIGGAK